ncbi:hypothetical protein BGAL_0024g00220 [Botrytis galanthina]|uniref:Uncharacterized protein n=1 Tax=Botrytis galanthina TaxID=278940 RepID=A0A4S8R8Z8_9HELO|nr:hypothetical protein BGAL_0024g00220 [Botrytis galanthina]
MESCVVTNVCEVQDEGHQIHAKSSPHTHIENYLDASKGNSSSSKVGDFMLIQVGNDRGPRTEAHSHVMREFWHEKKLQMAKKARVS